MITQITKTIPNMITSLEVMVDTTSSSKTLNNSNNTNNITTKNKTTNKITPMDSQLNIRMIT